MEHNQVPARFWDWLRILLVDILGLNLLRGIIIVLVNLLHLFLLPLILLYSLFTCACCVKREMDSSSFGYRFLYFAERSSPEAFMNFTPCNDDA